MERLIDMLGCGNTVPQERIRWARTIVELARAEGVEEGVGEEEKKIKRTCLDGIGVWDGYVMVPASVLAPKEKPGVAG